MAIWSGTDFETATAGDRLEVFDAVHFDNVLGSDGNCIILATGYGPSNRCAYYSGGTAPAGSDLNYVRVFPSGTSPIVTMIFYIRNFNFFSFDPFQPFIRIYNSSLQEVLNLSTHGGATKDFEANGLAKVDTGIQIEAAQFWYRFTINLTAAQFKIQVDKIGGGMGPPTYTSAWTAYNSNRTFDKLTEFWITGYGSAGATHMYLLDNLSLSETAVGSPGSGERVNPTWDTPRSPTFYIDDEGTRVINFIGGRQEGEVRDWRPDHPVLMAVQREPGQVMFLPDVEQLERQALEMEKLKAELIQSENRGDEWRDAFVRRARSEPSIYLQGLNDGMDTRPRLENVMAIGGILFIIILGYLMYENWDKIKDW